MIKIAEANPMSPWDGKLSNKPMKRLIEIAIEQGDWVSIHTEKPWGGSLDWILKARDMTDKPVLAKGVHKTDKSICDSFKAGADYVLCVGRNPGMGDRVVIEPLTDLELLGLDKVQLVMWNRRDLNTGTPKMEDWGSVRSLRKGWLGCASYGAPFPDDADACLFSVR